MSAKQKAFIIGSGIAGIACAIRLAVQGFAVTVFEKNSYPGGKLFTFEKDDYRFDTGPSLFVQPQNIEELFTLAGEDIHEYIKYKPIDIACKYFYEDGTIINAYTNKEKFANELQQKTGEPVQHAFSYLKESEKIYNNIGNIFLSRSLHKKSTWRNRSILKALATTRPGYIFSTLHEANKKKFKSPHIIQLFNRYATYSGSNPYKAPAMLKLIPHLELNEGVFYPQGGMIAINNSLYNLAVKKGVIFKFNTSVERIIESDNEAKGIVINHENLFADVVISNADVYFTYLKLLNNSYLAKKTLKQERSSSALIFYWGIKQEFPHLELHNIFFSKDYEAEFKSIFKTKNPYNDPTVYINITSKMEPGIHAPAAKENWFVMVNVASDLCMSEEAIINAYKKNILAKLNRMLQTDIQPLIESETILHPKKIEEETMSFSGALYGTSSNSRKAAFLRHPNFSKDIHRLYFTGGSVHPGGGIPLCLKSAEITTEIIANDSKKWKTHE
ncbi:MAG: 1-hydroxycarotenoid 3,4-desaturase CrtD [Parafilimonas sp.]